MVCAAPPLKVTVFAPGVNVEAPVLDQFPLTLNVPDGAIKVPLVKDTFEDVMLPAAPVNVPPDTVNAPVFTVPDAPQVYIPPLMVKPPVCVWLAVLAVYVPLVIVVKLETALVNPFALNPPAPFNVKKPATDKLLVRSDTPPDVLVIEILPNAEPPEFIV